MTCNRNCFECSNKDCYVDTITNEERKEQDIADNNIRYERLYTSRQKIQFRYNHSDKGKETRQRYYESEKGKENEKKKSQRRIASGKNAEACRRYYYKKKAEKELV